MSEISDARPPLAALPRISVDALTALIAPRLEPESIVAFDADGTLWSGDIGMDMFKVVLGRRFLRQDASAALTREAAAFQLPVREDPNEQGELLYRAFEEGRYPEERAFAMMAWALTGHRTSEVTRLAGEVAALTDLSSRLMPEAVAVLRWFVAHEVPVLIVSASPTLVVQAAIAHVGLAVTRVFGMTVATEGGRLLPALVGTPTYGPGKAETLRQACAGQRVELALGDSAFDLPMLCAARCAVAVRPKPALVARAGECPGLLELAPDEPSFASARSST